MKFERQEGIVPSRAIAGQRIYMIGAGGIGSLTASFLTKMGVVDLTVIDYDRVEEHNIPSQMYPLDSVGELKVDALADYCEMMSGTRVDVVAEELLPDQELSGIVISAVDSMRSRKAIWEMVKVNPNVDYFIDGRMGGWTAVRIAIDMSRGDDIAYYEKTLFSDEEGLDLPCTERAVIFNTGAIGSMIADTVAKHVQKLPVVRHLVYDIMNSLLIHMEE